MYRILLVGKDTGWNQKLSDYLSFKSLELVIYTDNLKARRVFQEEHFDVLLLNMEMPMQEGYYPEGLRRRLQRMPVILFSYDSTAVHPDYMAKIQSDQYLKQPFTLDDIYLSIVNLIRKYFGDKRTYRITCGNMILYKSTREVVIDGRQVRLAKKEFDLLHLLMENKGKVMTRDKILNHVWGIDYFGEDRVVDTHVKKLRKKLGKEAVHIKTVHKLGYMVRD